MIVIVREEDAESIEREFNETLDMLGEEYTLHNERVEIEDSEDPEDENLIDYEDAA
jgi:hypothetical protein